MNRKLLCLLLVSAIPIKAALISFDNRSGRNIKVGARWHNQWRNKQLGKFQKASFNSGGVRWINGATWIEYLDAAGNKKCYTIDGINQKPTSSNAIGILGDGNYYSTKYSHKIYRDQTSKRREQEARGIRYHKGPGDDYYQIQKAREVKCWE